MKKAEYFKKERVFSVLMMLMAALVLSVTSCKKDPEPEPQDEDPELSAEVLMLNQWIWNEMNDYYLWEQYIPDLDYKKQPDPEQFFYDLLYEEDRNSWITDDYDALVNMFQGVELSYGMNAQPAYINDKNEVGWVVLFVTPDSPASEAGIKRGDIIITVDGQVMTGDNYADLYYQNSASFGFGELNGEEVVSNGVTIDMTAVELNQNPVIHNEVIDYEGAKIGYLVYTQFTSGQEGEWLDTLNIVFDEFIAQGVTDMVVDLRYNPGGSLDLSAYIASTLGSAAAMESHETFVNLVWNDMLNNYWKQTDLNNDGSPDGDDSEQLVVKLPSSDRNMNLPRVYFLTTGGTASASESLITGLYPYTEVIQIGETTYGKCYASITIGDSKTPKRHNWAMQPLVLKYSNAEGYTDFVDGLTPDFIVNEYLAELYPFGSLDDPMLSKALEEITGVASATTKAAQRKVDFTRLPVPRKPLPERFIQWPEKSVAPGSLPLE